MSSRVAVLLVLVGSVHVGFSLSWALGAHTWLRTVGPWAVDLAQQHPVGSALVLLGVTAAKAAGVVVPLLVAGAGSVAARRWHLLCRVGGALLAAYGGVNAVVAWLVLGGVIAPDGGYDRSAMLGHAFLWDPLFLVWGLLLALGLRSDGPSPDGSSPDGPRRRASRPPGRPGRTASPGEEGGRPAHQGV